MTLSATHLTALRRLVSARVAAGGESDPQCSKWRGLLAAVDAELVGVPAANDTTAPAVPAAPALGDLVFAIDLPLQVEKPRQKPRLLFSKPGEKPRTLKGQELKKALAAGHKPTADWTPITTILCPTLNVYKSMRTFAKQKVRKVLAERIVAERLRWPNHPWGGRRELVKRGASTRMSPVGGRRRFVRVTRHSSRRPDDMSPDVLGGKMPLDQLVDAGILGDDSDAWCAREGRWEAAKTGEGYLRIEVFELAGEAGVPRTPAQRKRAARGATGRQDRA